MPNILLIAHHRVTSLERKLAFSVPLPTPKTTSPSCEFTTQQSHKRVTSLERLMRTGRPRPNILLVSSFLRAVFAWQAALKQNKSEVGCDMYNGGFA